MVLPQTVGTRLAHRKAVIMPSAEWSKAQHYVEKVNENLRRYVIGLFAADGHQACSPVLLPQRSKALSTQYGFASSWSERHTAHVCRLGTFGVSDGLITPAGKADRVGSVIVRKRFKSTPRSYKNQNEWCLFHSTGRYLRCARRCPAGAISKSGHDKVKCREYIHSETAVHVEKEQLGFKANSCGLCQPKVPCESQIPLASKRI